MTFSINKCAIMVIKTPDSRVVGDRTFYIVGHPIPKSNAIPIYEFSLIVTLILNPKISSNRL